jgi:hypothetical protein
VYNCVPIFFLPLKANTLGATNNPVETTAAVLMNDRLDVMLNLFFGCVTGILSLCRIYTMIKDIFLLCKYH